MKLDAPGKNVPGQSAANGEIDKTLAQQLKPVGRVSLAVQVPLEGTVYHFRKLKDHAQIEAKVKQQPDPRTFRALWILAAGALVYATDRLVRRRLEKRRPAHA